MQAKIWEHLRVQADQPQWKKAEEAEKFVKVMLEVQQADATRKIAYDVK